MVDPPAERALLGAMLLRSEPIGEIAKSIDVSDFHTIDHQRVYASILALYENGEPIDEITVAAHSDVPLERVVELTSDTPAVSAWRKYMTIVITASRRRRAINAFSELSQRVVDDPDIDSIIGDAMTVFNDPYLGSRATDVEGLVDVADFMSRAVERAAQYPWQIPYLIRRMWRIIIIGPEGVGKGTLMRQIALHAAAGRHPFAPKEFLIEPLKVLYLDGENPETTIERQITISNRDMSMDLVGEAAGNLTLWNLDNGLDIRSRRDRMRLDAVLQQLKPDLVCAGPLYKLYRRSSSEDLEQSTIEFLGVLDDLRKRHRFSLILEHHQPKAAGGGPYRTKDPFGSAALKRWPEIGITLEPEGIAGDVEVQDYIVGRFREDREPNAWPTGLMKGKPFQQIAWAARWEHGRDLPS